MRIKLPFSMKAFSTIKRFAGSFLIITVTFILSGSLGLAETVDLTPTKDTFVNQAEPETGYGSSEVLRTKTKRGGSRQTLLQFNLSSIPSGVLILNAELKLFSKKVNSLYRMLTSELMQTWEPGANQEPGIRDQAGPHLLKTVLP